MEYRDLIAMGELLERIDGASDTVRLAIVEATAATMRESAELRAENDKLKTILAAEESRLDYA